MLLAITPDPIFGYWVTIGDRRIPRIYCVTRDLAVTIIFEHGQRRMIKQDC
jgi:hypothetical protein